jgi:hypothetical protein
LEDTAMTAAAVEPPPLEIGRVFGDTFALIRRRPLTVFGIALIVIVPLRLLLFALPYATVDLQITYSLAYVWALGSAGLLLASMLAAFGQGALAGAAVGERGGTRIGFFASLRPALSRLPAILILALLQGLGIGAGLVLLLVPGIILATIWSVAVPAMVAEQTSIMRAFRRSQELTENLLGQIFLLFLAANVGTAAFVWAVNSLGRIVIQSESGNLLFSSLVELVRSAFNISLACCLYAKLVERRGDGPMREQLSRIFE